MKIRARENPFASDRVEELLAFEPEWLGHSWEGLIGRLRDQEYRAAVVGAHGSGKTTLLSGLRERLEQQGFRVEEFFLNEEQKTLSEIDWGRLTDVNAGEGGAGKVLVFLDGAEQMSRKDWRRFQAGTSCCGGLVITQHRPGKLPLLVKTETDIKMFREFVGRLAPDFDCDGEVVERMYFRSNGNIREALWQCYDWAAKGRVA